MDTSLVALALLSALLHAGWNAAVKAGSHPREIMTAQMVIGAVLVLPVLGWTGLPAAASWPWIAVSTALNLVTVTALLKAYELVGFGMAYPVVRALSVMLVVPFAALLSGEAVSVYGLAGVALIALSLVLLAVANAGETVVPRRAFALIALCGVSTAAYVICDAQGVRSAGSAWAYGFTVSITNALVMLAMQGGAPGPAIARHARSALPIAIASMVSYLMILWVFTRGPIAPAAALRDTSAVFAIVIAVLWLREPMTRLRLFTLLLAAAAVPLLRLA